MMSLFSYLGSRANILNLDLDENKRIFLKQPILKEKDLAKIEFLEEMVKSYGLSNVGKAVRCLVDYARAHPEQQASIFSEIRCYDC